MQLKPFTFTWICSVRYAYPGDQIESLATKVNELFEILHNYDPAFAIHRTFEEFAMTLKVEAQNRDQALLTSIQLTKDALSQCNLYSEIKVLQEFIDFTQSCPHCLNPIYSSN